MKRDLVVQCKAVDMIERNPTDSSASFPLMVELAGLDVATLLEEIGWEVIREHFAEELEPLARSATVAALSETLRRARGGESLGGLSAEGTTGRAA